VSCYCRRERADGDLYWRHTAPLCDWGVAAVLGTGEARCNFVTQGFGGNDGVDDEFARESLDIDVTAVLELRIGRNKFSFVLKPVPGADLVDLNVRRAWSRSDIRRVYLL
jgi:hypothetical protein